MDVSLQIVKLSEGLSEHAHLDPSFSRFAMECAPASILPFSGLSFRLFLIISVAS